MQFAILKRLPRYGGGAVSVLPLSHRSINVSLSEWDDEPSSKCFSQLFLFKGSTYRRKNPLQLLVMYRIHPKQI